MEETRFFLDLGLLLAGALVGGVFAHALRQPLIVGYILAGVLLGPFTPGPSISDPGSFRVFADIGVVLLMFSIGVEFSLGDLLRAGKVALLGGPITIVVMMALTVAAGRLLGWPLPQSLIVGAAASLGSTMVLLKLLLEQGELASPHGRVLVGTTIVEDLAAVVLMVLVPALGAPAASLWPVGRALAQAAILLGPVLWMARHVVPRILDRVARTRNMELFLLVSLAIAIGTAALTSALGLSLALGAFLAGLVISESEFAHETLARTLPIRDIFVAVFFVSLGTFIRPASVVVNAGTIGVLVALVVLGKFVVRTLIVRAAAYPLHTAILAGIGLTQIGEFSYVIAGVGRMRGLVSDAVYEAVLATSFVTIILNALVFRAMREWVARGPIGARAWARAEEVTPEISEHVVLCGFGRLGRQVADALDAFRIPYIVIDLDPEAIRKARSRGAPALFGDASNDFILHRANVDHARLGVVAIPDFQPAYRSVVALKHIQPEMPVLVRVHHEHQRAIMAEAGATEVIQPEVEAGLTIARHMLERLGIDHTASRHYLERAREALSSAPRS